MSTQPTDSDAQAMRTGECIGSDNDAEWRDLQNAQLLSMQGVWDNPADEVWNSTSVDLALILVIPRFRALGLPEASCWPVADLGFINPPLWRERAQVEHDETLLQPVAYGVLLNDQGHAWCYQRAGGDARVDGCFSCGVGGHVDEQDAQPLTRANPGADSTATPGFNPIATLRTAWLRELTEELCAGPVHLADVRLHGLVYEGQTAIGRVHLGVVFVARWCGPTPPQPAQGESLSPVGFLPLAQIATDPRFEHWSRLVAQHLFTQPHA